MRPSTPPIGRSLFTKAMASALSASLLWSLGSGEIVASEMPDLFAPVSALPQFNLVPPNTFGRISDYYKSSTTATQTPLVVLIQDLHAHYGVKKNIAALLDFLSTKLSKTHSNALPFGLAIEGTSGPVDSSVMSSFPDAALKEEATQFLMRAGELNGTEYFAVRRGLPHALVGVEDPELYVPHRNLFRQTLADRQPLVKMLTALQSNINELPRRVYRGPLRDLDQFQRAYERGEMSTLQWIVSVVNAASTSVVALSSHYPELASFFKNGRMGREALSPEALRQQVAEFLASAQVALSVQEKKNLEALGHQGISESYFLYLRDLVYQHQLYLDVPADLAQYMEYVYVSRTSGMDTVLHEANELFFKLEKRAAQANAEKDVLRCVTTWTCWYVWPTFRPPKPKCAISLRAFPHLFRSPEV